ncbi:ubiquitin fusion degradation protein UFD1-domain-containing protein [Protomyces lactucae-debilis]|uniref:Ubiquitin fusion degradation protein 1 n=1 Tax=Protomyces lactucae-debilis TaxID=2754530 RepID=A0A1Y2F7Q6_PROLT|nr:ubiquitin fusion degradation protein UFD1-domain-containing protein [Protomyces lactucae-debilis]ORY79901.1 ubiquitin fusion degradation protein UFD1-domain-containing protein [Protomyces lactucae-debilis]
MFANPWSRSNQRFNEYYRCYSTAMLSGPQRDSVNYGGKIILPPSALDKLTRLNISYPMLFELSNSRKAVRSHAGVLEFIAEEGRVYLPHWMMRTLLLDEGDLLQILSTDLPLGSFVQLEPQSPDFLDISDPKAVLENTMRNFATLTTGDVFQFNYNDRVYEVAVLQVKPETDASAVCVIETDLEVDFAAPKGYVEPERTKKTAPGRGVGAANAATLGDAGALSKKLGYADLSKPKEAAGKFSGGGQKMSGKAVTVPAATGEAASIGSAAFKKASKSSDGASTGPPAPLRVPPGTLFFGYELRLPKEADGEEKAGEANKHKFSGRGVSIKQAAKKGSSSATPSVIEID